MTQSTEKNKHPKPTDPVDAYVVYTTFETGLADRNRLLEQVARQGYRLFRSEPEGIHGSERHVFVPEAHL